MARSPLRQVQETLIKTATSVEDGKPLINKYKPTGTNKTGDGFSKGVVFALCMDYKKED